MAGSDADAVLADCPHFISPGVGGNYLTEPGVFNL